MQRTTFPQDSYETEKLTFAAYLLAAEKSELLGVRPVGRGKAVAFVLSQSPSTDDVTAFFSGAGAVSALRYAETINTLKSVAHEVHRCR